ncbi:Serine/threonine-protein kinase PrkC [Vibrio aerogenes CECT 7868]|uniref:Serine/threonine-protein kinase PrkC n=1 Tax=Vibrio aerogenes CECT 7868 TaxID=1216006 RepID=A0A1M5Y138_9VIBR|nr:protein kinase [Vibrio aerogenes]SHI05785.1 Serine/threonine-protein kinase PrkC [Vibrio aerogenes CECT 7868]
MEHEISDVVAPDVRFRSSEYQLLEKIGEGGFGQVFKAIHNRTRKNVAIKFLTFNSKEPAEKRQRNIARFHRECDLIRRLNHPNIVSLIDKGQQGSDLLYAVYEFVDGVTLKDYLASHGPIPPTEAAEIMACVLDALAHAHEQGVIHRDIKPANIMLYHVGAKRHVKVLDFGIGTFRLDARQENYQTLTLTQETLGTPTYSAPEQLRGEPALPQTDLYIWGLVFLECLTGVPTIQGRSVAAVFHQQLSTANVPLGPLAGHHSALFFRRILNKKPLERPGNTVEVYQEFCQLHFADLEPGHTVSRPADISQEMTEINPVQRSYSQLTERKQIAVLSIILTHHRIKSPEVSDLSPASLDIPDMMHTDQMHQCIDIAVRYGATHVGTLGDTLLFYFGYPVAGDNDSRLCARAALDLLSNLNAKQAQLSARHGLICEIKSGLHTGMMCSIDGGLPEGHVASHAMHLARSAAPGKIVCSKQIQVLLENQLIFEPLSASPAPETSPLYLLQGEQLSEAFGFLRSTHRHRAFFGRETLLSQLIASVEAVDQPCTTQQRLIHLRGEAGIGKSRLLSELNERRPDQTQLILQCLPEYQNNSLYPVLNLLIFRYQLDSPDGYQRLCRAIETLPFEPDSKRQSLAVLWIWCHPQSHALAAISLTDEKQHRQQLASMPLQQQRACLFLSLGHLLCPSTRRSSSSGQQHCLFICEDLHWADPATIAFIRDFTESAPFIEGHCCWINTSRETIPPVLDGQSTTTLTLDKLSHQECRHFIDYLFDGQPVSDKVIALLIGRSDGNPLFLEELISYIRHRELVRQVNGRIEFVVNDPGIHVPETLRESLQYQLDQLTFAKDTALLGAAIGRSFSKSLLFCASGKEKTQIQADLDELQRAELILIQRNVDDNQYVFQHALIRDAIYESAPRHQAVHRQIARALESMATDATMAPQAALLAHHWALTETPEQAIPYYLQAGEVSSGAFAVDDAIHYFSQALALIQTINKADPQTETAGKSACFSQQPFVSKQPCISKQKCSADTGLADNYIKLGRHEQARQHYRSAIQEAEKYDPLTCAKLCIKYGKSWETLHDHTQALAAHDQAEQQLNRQTQHGREWWQVWLHLQVARLDVYYWRNDVAAMRRLTEVIAPEIEHINDPLSKAFFYDAQLQLQFRQTRYKMTEDDVEIAQKAYQTSLETSHNGQQIHSLFSLGVCCLFSQHYDEADIYLHQALTRANKESDATQKTRCLSYLALLCRINGNCEATRDFATQALTCAEKSDMQDYIALASANLAWVAYKHQAYSQARTLLQTSHHIWQALSGEFPFPLQWVALLVELDLLMISGDPATAPPESRVDEIVAMLTDVSQHDLPDLIIAPLKTALRQTQHSPHNAPFVHQALDGAKKLGYL